MPLAGGTFLKKAFNASKPPADAPNPTTGNNLGGNCLSIFDCDSPDFVSLFSGIETCLILGQKVIIITKIKHKIAHCLPLFTQIYFCGRVISEHGLKTKSTRCVFG